MSAIFDLRNAAKTLLLVDDLWTADEIIIKRRTDIWNDVATSIECSKSGQCLVIGLFAGSASNKQRKGSSMLMMDVTLAFSLVERHQLADPNELTDGSDEDSRFEETLLRLQGSALGRNATLAYSLEFDGFAEQEDEQYLIRQATYKTELILKPTPPAP